VTAGKRRWDTHIISTYRQLQLVFPTAEYRHRNSVSRCKACYPLKAGPNRSLISEYDRCLHYGDQSRRWSWWPPASYWLLLISPRRIRIRGCRIRMPKRRDGWVDGCHGLPSRMAGRCHTSYTQFDRTWSPPTLQLQYNHATHELSKPAGMSEPR